MVSRPISLTMSPAVAALDEDCPLRDSPLPIQRSPAVLTRRPFHCPDQTTHVRSPPNEAGDCRAPAKKRQRVESAWKWPECAKCVADAQATIKMRRIGDERAKHWPFCVVCLAGALIDVRAGICEVEANAIWFFGPFSEDMRMELMSRGVFQKECGSSNTRGGATSSSTGESI